MNIFMLRGKFFIVVPRCPNIELIWLHCSQQVIGNVRAQIIPAKTNTKCSREKVGD